MSSTPRKSSIASRRAPPASLRLPSASRKASNPHLSLIFAQGGSSIPQNETGESSKSEAALSRQLDADLGGQRMGLRSRRSSSATVHTMRTTSAASLLEDGGMKSPVLPEEEEEETEGLLYGAAGPSRTPMRINGVKPSPLDSNRDSDGDTPIPRGGGGGGGARFVDPKTSSAWLRWNPPPPTFPKSGSIGKGKGKEVIANGGESMKSVATEKARAGSTDSPKPTDQPVPPALAKEDSSKTNGEPSSLAPPITEEPPGLSTPKRSWWGRSPLPASPKPPPLPSQTPKNPLLTAPNAPGLQGPVVADPAPLSTNIQPAQPKDDDSPSTTLKPDQPVPPRETKHAAAQLTGDDLLSNGWFSYLTWGRSTPNPTKISTPKPSQPDTSEEATLSVDQVVAPQPVEPVIQKPAPVPADLPPEAPAVPTSQDSTTNAAIPRPAPGWGGYLYSFVSSQPSTPPVTAPNQPNAPVLAPLPLENKAPPAPAPVIPPPSPSPVPAPAPATVPESETRLHIPQPESTPGLADSPSLAPGTGSLRKASVTSTSGWLSYLAFRAGQKKITGSTIASSTGSPRPSGEQGREEVMDFSQDPDFPGATPAKDRSMPPPPIPTAGAPKGGATKPGVETRGKRLSISSTRSAKTPLSSSPAQPTKLDAKPPSLSGRPPSTKQTPASSLPAPPQPPASQPNLVIPTFSTTFDRPPRSLPPLPPADAGGLAAATSGLAWKALSAAGTYVYRSESKLAPPTPGAAQKETRGLKEGRSVGAELPRRLELGGAADDGWKGVRRVVVVGVHGWFPAKMLNSVIGEPTGTSTKFATMMGAAVTKFFEEKGLLDDQFRLTLMPLEGEGTIDHRVDKLYKAYLSNPAWINELRRADAIFFAAHSQGCIVTAHLLWRMITQGHIRTPLNREAVARCEWAFGPIGLLPPEEPRRGRKPAHPQNQDRLREAQKVAMLAMCGVHLGPLYSISTSTVIQPYLQWFENAAARELFEFQESTSSVSVAYQKALSMILENDVRVVLLASLNDQVVPIYGASFSTATHPLLLRALFVDGASYSASDFMTNLLCFAFMLRNAGIDDQRLVEHLSEATAGSLTGLGHSSPYEESACYDLVVDYLFNSGPARKPHERLSIEPFSVRDTRNDFELPWIMRALVDSPEVKDLFPEELKELKEGILAWKPNTKALKEIKRRLEPMAGRQSKLRPLAHSASSTSLNSQHTVGKAAGKDGKVGSGLGKDW